MSALLAVIVGLSLAQQRTVAPKVAVLPFALKDGTETANQTARDAVKALFEEQRIEVLSPTQVLTAWERDLKQPRWQEIVEPDDAPPDMPDPKALLRLGQMMKADMVCAGRVKWHTKSVWVALGPKTKADAIVDVLLIDVKKKEVLLRAEKVKSDSTRKEHALETAGALFVSFGVTALSGGPKTPHQQKAVTNALALAFEPWLKTLAGRSNKIE